MAGRRQREQVAPSTALVAAAYAYQGVGATKIENVYRSPENWQKEAWDFYDNTPELRYAASWIGNAMSRVILRPGEVDGEGNTIATTDSGIKAALDAIWGNSDGMSAMLHSVGLHLTVAGECYLVGRQINGGSFAWEIVGVREIQGGGAGSAWTIKSSVDGTNLQLGPNDTVIRIWRQHPVERWRADSPVKALIPTLTEIKYLTLHIFAQTTSRLTGAGTWVLPDTVEFPAPLNEDGTPMPFANKADGATKALGQRMAQAIRQPGDPSALVPIMFVVDKDSVDKVKPPIHFWSPFDEAAVDSRKAALQRLGVGLELPPEVIFGMSSNASSSGGTGTGVSHWGSWQIEDSAIKLHIEPLVGVFVNALILKYLRPVTSNAKASVLVDSTPLKLQPDRSREASEAYDRGELSAEGLRFYNGLEERFKPTAQDDKRQIVRKIATGSASPDMVADAARQLGVDITPPADGGGAPAPQTPPQPTLRNHPRGHALPGQMALLTAMSEPLVLRALERAGNRLRNAGVKPPDVDAAEVYQFAEVNGSAAKLLEGAWCHVPAVAEGVCDPEALTKALQAYVENLFVERTPHTREALQRYLSLVED